MKSKRVLQPRPLTAIFGTKVDQISFMALHQMNLFAALGSPVFSSEAPTETQASGGRYERKMAFTAEEMRHHFAIETLDKPSAFRPQRYLYTCIRCKWIFRLNDSRGFIIALDGLGRDLAEPENSRRTLTFHQGPCPAFQVIEYLAAESEADILRSSRLPAYLSRFVNALRNLANRRHSSRSHA
jgi:hypothetical protein